MSRFIRAEEDDKELTWEKRMAIKYYEKLFKEYVLADMTFYKQGKVSRRACNSGRAFASGLLFLYYSRPSHNSFDFEFIDWFPVAHSSRGGERQGSLHLWQQAMQQYRKFEKL
ncbi:MAG TPA: hypothetical protein V6C97_24495 [Oculatellaceae cyanobacterium]